MTKAASIKLFFFFLLSVLLPGFSAQAQLKLLPLNDTAQKKGQAAQQRSLLLASDTLLLPFWDDFSRSRSVPDSLLWENSQQIAITNTIAVKPPSFNVATFDGLAATGRPYSQDPNLSGPSDSLLSLPINLGSSQLSLAEQASAYLSFYWQLQGRGNRPDAQDSLRLFFYAQDGSWHQVWSMGGNAAIDSASFQQELISLHDAGIATGADFFHEGFRFKFISENRQSGQYDLWHLDYIYLDKNRSSNDRYYQDRSISEVPVSLFHPYTAMPLAQFFAAPEVYTNDTFSFSVFSLERPGKEEAVEYNIYTLSAAGDTVAVQARRALIQDEFGNLLRGQQNFNIEAPGIGPDALLPYAGADSLYLNTFIVLTSEEGQPFFSSNDTARMVNVLDDYFAYDDGTAEYGMEVIGGRGVRVAYSFELKVQDTLTHIDLYLPYFSQNLAGQLVDLKIWRSLALEEGAADSLLYTQRDVSLNNSSALNTFDSYALRLPLVLGPGTFYIGFEKRSERFLALGFDRNTNSQEQVFVSRDGISWFPGQDEAGSLMMRPRFERNVDPAVLSSREPELNYPVSIYPNPSRGSFRVDSEALSIQVYNMQGQLLRSYPQQPGQHQTLVNLEGQPAGIYLINLLFRDGSIRKKVLIK